jgi:hypothetical protein
VTVYASKAHGNAEQDCIPQSSAASTHFRRSVMSKRNLMKVVITGLLLGAGGANAASVFPSSTNEVSPTGYAISIEGTTQASTGATRPVFPSAAIEQNGVRENYVPAARGVRPSIAETGSVFPISVNDTGRL